MSGRTLRYLSIVTWCVDAMDRAAEAWITHLGYRDAGAGHIDTTLASAWGTPAAAGLPYRLLRPASGEPVFIRYVETGERRGFESPATAGWMATELLVQDPDALAQALRGSPFRRLAGPGDLFPGPKAPRAMQAVGPCGELLYFTRILPGGSRFGMKGARSPVDRPFIVTIAGTSTARMRAFYESALGMRVMEPMPFINGILAHSCGADPATIFPTSISPIPGRRFLIELDEFPPGLPARPRRDGQLPPGMAMVGCRVASLDALTVPLRAPAVAIDGPPYDGARVAVVAGGAGEWLELIESRS